MVAVGAIFSSVNEALAQLEDFHFPVFFVKGNTLVSEIWQ